MFAVLLFSLSLLSCKLSDADFVKKQLKHDSSYFLALQALEENDEDSAIKLFKKAAQKGSYFAAQKSLQSLVSLGSADSRAQSARELAQKYNDNESLFIACQELFRQNEYSAVIDFTDSILAEDYERLSDSELQNQNNLIKLRIESLFRQKDARFESEFYSWIESRPISSAQYSVYKSYFEQNIKSISATDSAGLSKLTIEQRIARFRINVFVGNYKSALSQSKNIIDIYNAEGKSLDFQLLSDIGKASLYGNSNSAREAANLEKSAKSASDSATVFYMYFYSARLYEKSGRKSKALANYRLALENSPRGKEFDSALWYLLNAQLKNASNDADFSDIIDTLETYASRISDSAYFDDFFDSLSTNLLRKRKWQLFYKTWKAIDGNFFAGYDTGFASEQCAGKFAYISGRLLQEGLAESENENAEKSESENTAQKEAEDAFLRVLRGTASFYYKVCALEKLNITDESLVQEYLCSGDALSSFGSASRFESDDSPAESKNSFNSEEITESAKLLFAGYIAVGFPQKIYSEWLKYKNLLNVESSVQVARFLNQLASETKDDSANIYAVQSLRIAARLLQMTQSAFAQIPLELLELDFPRFFSDEISSACAEFDVPEHIMYALVRTESFFERSVSSSAGANGLTQLMRATADDEAKKLKLPSDYDILDPETNTRIGTHYLKYLIDHAENNSVILAIFAYNGGMANVKKWTREARRFQNSRFESKSPAAISLDLFLETLPFSETVDYGRKLVEASALYAFIYEGITPALTVRQIFD